MSGTPAVSPPSDHGAFRRPLRSVVDRVIVAPLLALAMLAGACGSEGAVELTDAEYRGQVQAVCEMTDRRRAEVTEPTEVAAVPAFADQVARDLAAEADAIRQIRPPDALDDDHRAFVQNTDDQAAAWRTLADTSPSDTDAFGAARDAIAELSFGRDDLAAAMGLDDCRRST